MAGSEFK